MNPPIKKIALIGPESTGKSSLAKRLSEFFKTSWVPEFARGYISSLDRKYTLEDIEYCAKEQLVIEEREEKKANRFLFCDTELIIARVWCEDVFKTVPGWMEEKIQTHRYDLFLLTDFDIPFRQDDVRENPHRRKFFFEWYRRELDRRNFPYEIISGDGEQRFSNALSAVGNIFRDYKNT